MMYRAGAAVAVAAVVAGAVFATPRVLEALGDEPAARPGGPGTGSETVEAPPTGSPAVPGETPTEPPSGFESESGWAIAGPLACYEEGFSDEDLPFAPTYLPEGFSPEPLPGPAREASRPGRAVR